MSPTPSSFASPPPGSEDRLTRGQIRALLQQHVEAGCADVLTLQPVNHFAAPAAPSQPASQPAPTLAKTTPPQTIEAKAFAEAPQAAIASPSAATSDPIQAGKPVVGGQAMPTQDHQAVVQQARQCAAQAQDIDALRAALEGFTGCHLKRTAKSTVFCDGKPGARVMLIGEAPGQDEDRNAKPFIGPSGQFLDTMLSHIGLSRDDNLYLTNLIAWRPPGNRNPTPEEIEICLPFLQRHIVLAKPDYLLLVGGSSAKALLQIDTGITRLRGQWKTYDADGRTIPALPLLHPAYLLRRPETKADMWADLCALKARLKGDA